MDAHHESQPSPDSFEPGSSSSTGTRRGLRPGRGLLFGLALIFALLLTSVGVTTAQNARGQAPPADADAAADATAADATAIDASAIDAPAIDSRALAGPRERPSLLGQYLESLDAGSVFERAPAADRQWFFDQLIAFYEERGYSPVWIDDNRVDSAGDLLRELEAADEHGLDPDLYGVDALRALIEEIRQDRIRMPGELLELEVETTASALLYLEHLLAGRVHPDETEADWSFEVATHADVAAALGVALRAPTLWDGLEALEPAHADYDGLQKMLKMYIALDAAGGWPTVPDGPSLALGDEDDPERLLALAERLRAENDLPDWRYQLVKDDVERAIEEGTQLEFGRELEEALRSFQERHGLAIDGKLGPNSLESLNVPASERVGQIAANLDRWRWLDRRLPKDRIMVNVASFKLYGYRDHQETLSMKVVVGKPTWKTPVFNDQMTYLEINPYWNVPASIAAAEILPAVRRDPSYLTRQGMEVLRGWNGNDPAADVSQIDWNEVGPSDVRFRQRPGPRNALGQIKFMFPNEHNVYLHDTPSQSGFTKSERALSHGCVRVADPEALADFILADHSEWTGDDVRDAIASRRHQRVSLDEPLPVYILYWTAFPGDDGRSHFRDDVYNYDESLIEELDVVNILDDVDLPDAPSDETDDARRTVTSAL